MEMKNVMMEFGGFPHDPPKIAEMEFHLLEELAFYTIVYHPYRPLALFCNDMGADQSFLQTAWMLVNDAYRSDIPLLYPPYMIALACILVASGVMEKPAGSGGGGSHPSSSGGVASGGGGGTPNLGSASVGSSTVSISSAVSTPTLSNGGFLGGGGGGGGGGGAGQFDVEKWFTELNISPNKVLLIIQELFNHFNLVRDLREDDYITLTAKVNGDVMLEEDFLYGEEAFSFDTTATQTDTIMKSEEQSKPPSP
ncbi:hypothetical protein HDU96_008201 [Phlyctochytrium bullatum]|nr:hypothetical protein HDU96_008201 [Phlyctochytrium bullatum]